MKRHGTFPRYETRRKVSRLSAPKSISLEKIRRSRAENGTDHPDLLHQSVYGTVLSEQAHERKKDEAHERKKDEIRVLRKKQIRAYLRADFLPVAPNERLLAVLEKSAFEELEVRLNDPNSFLWWTAEQRKAHRDQRQKGYSTIEQVNHLAAAASYSPDVSAMDLDMEDDGNVFEAPEQCNPREVGLIQRLYSNVDNMAELAYLIKMLVNAGYSEEECIRIYKLSSIDDDENTETPVYHTVNSSGSHNSVIPPGSHHIVVPGGYHHTAIPGCYHHTVIPPGSHHNVSPSGSHITVIPPDHTFIPRVIPLQQGVSSSFSHNTEVSLQERVLSSSSNHTDMPLQESDPSSSSHHTDMPLQEPVSSYPTINGLQSPFGG